VMCTTRLYFSVMTASLWSKTQLSFDS